MYTHVYFRTDMYISGGEEVKYVNLLEKSADYLERIHSTHIFVP